MKANWIYTTAIALVIGAGAAIAQAPDTQKRDEGPRGQSPAAQSKETDRPAASDRMKERAAQPEQKGGGKDMQRGEGPSQSERSKQAQEPKGREAREPTRQTQDQERRDRPTTGAAQQSKEEQRGRDAKQTTDEKMRGREGQPKQDRAQDTKQPADTKQQTQQQMDRDTKQQTQQQQMDRDRRDQRDQAAQPSGTPTQQQTGRPTDATQDQGTKTGQAPGQAGQRAATVDDSQRRQIVDQLRRDRTARQDVNVRVDIGERLPPRVQARRLPPDIVRIAPHYRNYEYTVIEDRVVIVDPRRREVIDILDEGPGYGRAASYGRERIVISDDTRTRFRELARGSSATVGATSPSGGMQAQNCLTLQPVPEEMARNNPELSNYRYLAVGDQIVLVDPQQQKVVQVID